MQLVRIRYGDMLLVGVFQCDLGGVRVGCRVLVKTERGTEVGEIVYMLGEVKPEDAPPQTSGVVLRHLADGEAEAGIDLSLQRNQKEFDFCQKLIGELKLPMNLVHVEKIYGGERIIFYFMAKGRVDFRELVKQLAKEYKTRIEMRQIGVRDETRLLGTLGHCGRDLCCRTFLKDLQPVTMKMAKGQKTTLDPTKISGRCGRLMCCLAFEEENYAKLREEMPKKGTRVLTPQGPGEVIDVELLAQKVIVDLGKGEKAKFPVADVTVVQPPPASDSAKQEPQGQLKPPTGPQQETDVTINAPVATHKSGEKV